MLRMNDTPSRVLADILKARPELLEDWRLCEALLRDHCGAHEREINLLVSALREGVPLQLRSASQSSPLDVIYKRLVVQLHNRRGIDEALASWAVDVWAQVLGFGHIGDAGRNRTARPSKTAQCGPGNAPKPTTPTPAPPATATPPAVVPVATNVKRWTAMALSLMAMALLIGFVMTGLSPGERSDQQVTVGSTNKPEAPSKRPKASPRPPIENEPPTASNPPVEAPPAIVGIRSVPSGSSVTIGQNRVGMTDRNGWLRVPIPPGEYAVVIRRQGYRDYTDRVRLISGTEVTVVANMEMRRSTLAVSTVAGATVEIDGVPSPARSEMAAGNHLVRVTKQGYVPFQKSVYVPPGEDVRVEASLIPAAAMKETVPAGIVRRLEAAGGTPNPVSADGAKPAEPRVNDVAEPPSVAAPPSASATPIAPGPEAETLGEASFRQALIGGDQPRQAVQKWADAIRSGRDFRLRVKHDSKFVRIHRLFDGTLTITSKGIIFEAVQRPNESFAVPWLNVKEVKENQVNKRDPGVLALELEVDRFVGGKRDTKNYKFVSGQGWIGPEQDVQCRDCVPLMPALVRLIQTMRGR